MTNKIQKLTQSRAEVQRILNESDGLRRQVESELATLKGEGEGSVSAAVEAGVRRVLGGASEAYDTLKEIEDYIEKDEAGAVALAQSIARLETEKVSTEDIDSALSTESENPVQNKVVTEELNKKVEKSEHDALAQSVENNKTATDEAINVLQEELNKKATSEALDALSGSVVSLKVKKADKDGNYPSLHVGTADTAIDLAGRGESVPAEFGFRASGGKSIKDGRAYIKRIKGNSVVWNQLFEPRTDDRSYNEYGAYITDNKDGSYTISTVEGGVTQQVNRILANSHNLSYAGHKLLITGCDGAKDGFGFWDSFSNTIGTNFKNNVIVTASKNGHVSFSLVVTAGTIVPQTTWKPRVYDLTKMFGSGNEPTTIEEFNARKPFVEDEYAYNEGEVIHMNTESIKSVGDNAWDEQWELGTFNTTTGENNVAPEQIRTKNNIKVLPNSQYYVTEPSHTGIWIIFYDKEGNVIESPLHGALTNGNSINCNALHGIQFFTTPINADSIRFYAENSYGATYNNDIMITLVHSGWKQDTDAGYQPYWQDTLPLPIIRKYFRQGMKSTGSAHDEIRYNKASGKWEAVQRIGIFDKWEGRTISNVDNPNLYAFPTGMLTGAATPKAGEVICIHEKYEGKSQDTLNATESNGIAVYTSNRLWIKDMDVTSDPEALITKLSGTKLYYELAGPIVTELDAEDQNFRDYYQVADFGTEEAIPATDAEGNIIPSAPFSADIIYQFNAVDMIREHELEITELQNIIATMQAQLTSLINGGQ